MDSDIQLYIGPYLVLLCITLMLFGVTCFQVYSYWVKYTRDHPRIKLFVLILWMLECLHTIMCVHMLYDNLIDEFGNLGAIEKIIWSAGAMIFIEACISSFSRGFSVVYIWQLSNGNILATAPSAVLLVCSLAFTLAGASLLYVRTTWADLHTHRGTYATLNTALVLAVLADGAVAAGLARLLRAHRGTFRRARQPTRKLVFYGVGSGGATLIAGVVVLFLFNFMQTSLTFGGVLAVATKHASSPLLSPFPALLHTNATLALINARRRPAGDAPDFHEFPLELRGASASAGGSGGANENRVQAGMKVSIFREVDQRVDAPEVRSPSRLSVGGRARDEASHWAPDAFKV